MMHNNDYAQIAYSIAILVFLVSGYVASSRNRNAPTIQYALVWVGIFLVLTLAYSFKERISAELLPSRAVNKGGHLVIGQSDDNHFYLDVLVNGRKIKFLIDTGATGITLNKKDAQNSGIDLNALEFDRIHNTANGQVFGASVKIDSMQVDSVVFKDVWASVNGGDLDVSLLGMAFLDRFKAYRVEGDKLYLEY